MHLFYCVGPYSDLIELSVDEAYHAANVLRLKVNSEIQITNGAGQIYIASIVEITNKKCFVKIESEIPQILRNSKLHLAVAPTKNIDRFEWFLEKATEVGIEEITPLLCRYSERKEIKLDRLNKLIVSAAKQSRHALFPKLNPMISFKEFVEDQHKRDEIKLIAHCESTPKVKMNPLFAINHSTLILVGPEGDFSPQEIELAEQNKFTSVTLGNYRLRTETAALMACMAFNLFITNNTEE
jgi:16S rRNA (uracil1498-N3)-methyltransferase